MQKTSEPQDPWYAQREKLIGLGEHSVRKTYYPELQQKLDELERFRALLDQSNDCIFLIQASDFTFIDVNESACRQLSYPREEIIAHPISTFLSDEAVERIATLVSAGPAQGWDRDTIVTRLCSSSGLQFPVEITIRLVTFNKALYGVAVARDITERNRAEKVLLENSRMLREMELARQIQLSLLPTAPPDVPGVKFGGCCVPAAHVGGDYYDYYRRDNGVVDLVVADVSGHSIGAALMTAEVRSVLHAEVHSFGSAGAILGALNDILYDDLNQAGLYLTLFYVKYDTQTRILTYANAGHVPPLLSRGNEAACRELDAEGLLIGVRKGVAFEEGEIQLQTGDLLILYTDGVTEAQNESGDMFGRGRLCDIMHAMQQEPPRAIIDAVLREVAAFTGSTVQEDDVTMVVMTVE